ncbi:hypothetical protein LHFGNBLO_001329 [Mesorhizobium sp. AR10]|uniref:hypothetical protein n=1 Tax=Mesorhizobium sp. AR10 TaxID=2865839 RepID=UPI00215E1119|nr:hypothetical protein [Mesorhizobium sp. AR10]UVK39914.1 hypothetical protein LHFGNBLO_001329 [Mesorhizobium sp. AR10]
MTLILTVLSPSLVVQVSDRMVTSSGRTFHAAANKAVVFPARDGFLSFGYTGNALFGGKPTDEWIAEQLWGIPLTQDMLFELRTPSVTKPLGIPRRQNMDVGLAIRTLVAAVERESTKSLVARVPYLQIVAAGWQNRKRLARPTFYSLTKPERSAAVQVALDNQLQLRIYETPLWTPNLPQIHAELRALPVPALTPDGLIEYMSNVVRLVAGATPLVGADLTAIVMPVPWRDVVIEYHPGKIEGAIFSSPFIVGRTSLWYPAYLPTGAEITSAGTKIIMRPQSGMDNNDNLFEGQPRRRG